jgi:hypothetical protein
VYNPYTDNTNDLNEFKPYTTQYKFKFLAINSLFIFSSDNLKPTSSFSFTYTDKVAPIKNKDLVLD